MREILFRAKRIDNGKWVEGYYFERKDTTGSIIESVIVVDAYEQIASGQRYVRSNLNRECFRVNPETVGQFTGLTDKNGKKIFEGDILSSDWGYKDEVEFDSIMYAKLECLFDEDCEIIGNIHDNPELLEADNND